MSTLCTFPGRFGDLLWALPTVRAISETIGEPVDLQICGEFAGLVPLLQLQPYLGAVSADPTWSMDQGWQARLYAGYEKAKIFQLGYRRWPALPLPVEIFQTSLSEYREWTPPLDLDRPWISVPKHAWSWKLDVAFGFSDCHFELKYGLMELLFGETHTDEDGDASEPGGLLTREGLRALGCLPAGSRWETEGLYAPKDWLEAARVINYASVFLGCCSALHVLAVALGKPVVCYEPMIARHDRIFYPLGQDGPQVTLVKGLDGKPTEDSRHTADAIRAALAGAPR